jgi:hypothetical protein
MKYVCVSGGADSTAMALLLWERGEEFEMVFSDTGAELPEVYWLLPRLAQKVGKELTVVNNGSFFQHFVHYGYMIPGPRIRWCTGELKQRPMDKYHVQMKADEVCIGIRADEPRRYKKGARGGLNFTYPLADAGLAKRDVKKICIKYDLLCPVYEWRSNVSCFCCFFQRKSDWLNLSKHHPTLYEVAVEWEKQNLATHKHSVGWNQRFTLENLRRADKAQLDLWPEPEEEPCLICDV